ncbi:MAG: hypothetical protein EOS70_23490 [Mesorhizobium sp.]|uniref:putative Ig domain-containing protein n=1 Tax=Mesorhizobium sp. TaxID=1871066 RepID=UPI000FEA4410|nr:putative Ig domain-containing protein [Mesorhizobium sp.]RWC29855.1 MAG: hypothetical protein EOS70_23490 [Mesorhizobium sp.]
MMLGTLAQRGLPGGGTPAWVPDDAIAFLDFVNEQYFSGGAERAVSTLLGGGFDPAAISASGMRIIGSNGNEPEVIGTFFSELAAAVTSGGTVVVDFQSTNHPGGFLMFIADGINLDVADEAILAYAGGGIEDYWDMDLFDVTVTGASRHKEAFTLARDVGGGDFEYAWSHDGRTAVTQTVDYVSHALPVDTILIGHDGVGTGNTLNDIYIRSITLYPAQLPAVLPALTSLVEELEISGTPITTTVEDEAYAGFTVSATGGTAPYAFSVFSGSLPTGISLNSSTGAVSGTPTTPGTSTGIVIRVTDDDGTTDDLASFDLEVTEALTPLISDTATYTPAADPRPAYQVPYTDPNFETTITRITGDAGTQIGSFVGTTWGTFPRHQYMKHCSWNADDSLIFIRENTGGTNAIILLEGQAPYDVVDVTSYPSGWQDARWHNVDPNLLIFVTTTAIKAFDVTDHSVATKHDYSGVYSDMSLGLGEGELSWDSDIVPIQATRTSDGKKVCFAYQISTDSILRTIVINGDPSGEPVIATDGGVGISPQGTYLCLSRDDGTMRFYSIATGALVNTFTEDEKPSHFSFAMDGSVEVVVGGDRSSGGGGHVIKRRMDNGASTVLNPNSFTYHTSGSSHAINTLWFATDYYPDSGSPYVDEIVVVGMDGSVVGRVCHVHKGDMTGNSDTNYWNEIHVGIARSGKQVIFKSSWDESDASPLSVFVCNFQDRSVGSLG